MKTTNKLTGTVGKYAEQELCRLIENVCCDIHDIEYILSADNFIKEYSYGFDATNADQIILFGHSENEVLSAVYFLLENLGYMFDTNTHAPQKLDFTNVTGKRIIEEPFVRLRGIRQHINFPMDISSYHLEDAKEYIRALARMKMNAITFHSYEGIWHNNPGHFFYGIKHFVPAEESLKKHVDNKSQFMIPECEAIRNDEKAVGEYAVYWLNEVMKTAHECGMHVTLSIEPNKNINVTKETLDLYPEIDCLELITPEGGGEMSPEIKDTERIKNHAVELYGESILDENGSLPGLDETKEMHSGAIYSTLDSLNRAITIWKNIKNIPIRIGLYVTCPETLYIVKRIMDKVLPVDMIRTYLPAHGAEAVNDAVKHIEFKPDDLQKTVLHSWIEFDGNMYLSQNASNAIARGLLYLKEFADADSIYAVYFNHWRTEENRVAIAYSGSALILPIEVRDWYMAYASRLGIPEEAFAEAMYKAGELDIFCRNNMFNSGFCFLPCWTNPGGGSWMGWKIESMYTARKAMQELIEILVNIAKSTIQNEGLQLIRFIINRYEASVLHVNALLALKQVLLTDATADIVENALKEGSYYADLYLEKTAETLPDRGCQGQLVDYAEHMSGYIKHLRKCYLNEAQEASPQTDNSVEPPPPPASI